MNMNEDGRRLAAIGVVGVGAYGLALPRLARPCPRLSLTLASPRHVLATPSPRPRLALASGPTGCGRLASASLRAPLLRCHHGVRRPHSLRRLRGDPTCCSDSGDRMDSSSTCPRPASLGLFLLAVASPRLAWSRPCGGPFCSVKVRGGAATPWISASRLIAGVSPRPASPRPASPWPRHTLSLPSPRQASPSPRPRLAPHGLRRTHGWG